MTGDIWSMEENRVKVDSAAVSIFVVILVQLTNTVFVNSTNITTNIKRAVLSRPKKERMYWAVLGRTTP